MQIFFTDSNNLKLVKSYNLDGNCFLLSSGKGEFANCFLRKVENNLRKMFAVVNEMEFQIYKRLLYMKRKKA